MTVAHNTSFGPWRYICRGDRRGEILVHEPTGWHWPVAMVVNLAEAEWAAATVAAQLWGSTPGTVAHFKRAIAAIRPWAVKQRMEAA